MAPRALIFEDDATLAAVLHLLLTERGFDVAVLIDTASCEHPSPGPGQPSVGRPCAEVIILDVDMVGGDALAFIHGQRGCGCRCQHIALVSGEWTPDQPLKSRELGCQTFDKPVPPRLLAAWLSEIDADLIQPVWP